MTENFNRSRVVAVQEDIVTIEMAAENPFPLTKNEVVFICPKRQTSGREERLKAEILRVQGRKATAQVFESTKGIGIGDPVDQTGSLLSVDLGPGLLGQVYDGLQNPLDVFAAKYGNFMERGVDLPALDKEKKWSFTPTAQVGSRLKAGDTIGTVQEGRFKHKIMIPLAQRGMVELESVQQGNFNVNSSIARVKDESGSVIDITMTQKQAVRFPFSEPLLVKRYCERLYPYELLPTKQRVIDTFFPVAKGGTGCIPGPFGAGKTVLQHMIARYSEVDIVVIVACGERAGEVVETITEFPELRDPKTGGALMDRTIIICNTSSMPVAAREASMYTGITIGEYYRQMGYDVLLLADSTSRWAQAMRETSGRMEEIPGEEAFPAYLDSNIKSVYERGGVLRNNDGDVGSLTMVGTVSPAGGNLEEPVTQSTLSTVKTFLGLSYDRAYKRFFPAIDPLASWSRYRAQLHDWFKANMTVTWVEKVEDVLDLLARGEKVNQMMQVTGEEGVSTEDYIVYQKALFVDMVYLQQDAFDDIDSNTSLERQITCFELIFKLVSRDYLFDDKAEVREFFTRLTSLFKNLNYSSLDSSEFRSYFKQLEELSAEHAILVESEI